MGINKVMKKKAETRYKDEDEIEERIKTNGYCCVDCGVNYLTEKQKSQEGNVSTFHKGVCTVCLKETSVTHIRHYNYLRKLK